MSFVAGQKVRASELRPPVVSMRRSSPQAVASQVWTPMSWDTEVVDTHGAWSATSPEEVVVPKTGTYLLVATMSFEPNTSGSSRGIRVFINGITVTPDGGEMLTVPSGASTRRASIALSLILPFSAGDSIRIGAYQDSGGSVNVGSVATYSPSIGLTFLTD